MVRVLTKRMLLAALIVSCQPALGLSTDKDQPAQVEADEVEYDFRTGERTYKGNVIVAGRESDDSLFDEHIATFEEDAGAYDQADAEGFIKLNALRMRIAASKGRSLL